MQCYSGQRPRFSPDLLTIQANGLAKTYKNKFYFSLNAILLNTSEIRQIYLSINNP